MAILNQFFNKEGIKTYTKEELKKGTNLEISVVLQQSILHHQFMVHMLLQSAYEVIRSFLFIH